MTALKSSVHILTLNVQGLRDKNKQKRVFEWSKQQRANILFLQETHLTTDIIQNFNNQFNGTVLHSCGTSNSRGVAVLIHTSVSHNILSVHCDTGGRFILVNIEIDNNCYSLTNIYAPNNPNERNSFFKSISENISELATGAIILGGDFNEILDTKLDRRNRPNTVPKRTKASNALGNLNKTHNLIDIWRVKHRQKIQFTWKRQTRNEASRIDYFCLQNDLESCVYSCDIRPAQISKTSHLSVSLKLRINKETRGCGFWKINNSILQDKEYQSLIKSTIEKYNPGGENEELTCQRTWEKIKVDVREASQAYSKQKSKRLKSRCGILEDKLSSLHKIQDENVGHDNAQNEIIRIENELEDIYKYKAKGAQIRARVEWVEKGEKNTKFFLGLEKSKQTYKNLVKLTTDDGRTVTEKSEILKEQVKFYSNLYTSKINNTIQMKQYFDTSLISNMLSHKEKDSCENEITEEECKGALFSMKLNKTPGSDGLSVEFYQLFWSHISPFFMNSVRESFIKDQLSDTQKHGILTLIFKSGDKTKLTNWRPITLLNVDYKIIARVLAHRLQRVISKIVSTDQKYQKQIYRLKHPTNTRYN